MIFTKRLFCLSLERYKCPTELSRTTCFFGQFGNILLSTHAIGSVQAPCHRLLILVSLEIQYPHTKFPSKFGIPCNI